MWISDRESPATTLDTACSIAVSPLPSQFAPTKRTCVVAQSSNPWSWPLLALLPQLFSLNSCWIKAPYSPQEAIEVRSHGVGGMQPCTKTKYLGPPVPLAFTELVTSALPRIGASP